MVAELLTERRGAVLRLTIDRPERNNALSGGLLAAIGDAVVTAAADPAVRVVVLAGAGGKAFSAGADLHELSAQTSDDARRLLEHGQDVLRTVETCGKPVVASVDGYALGGGFELCLAASVIVASDRARFGLPEVKLGLLPGYGGTQRLTRLVGRQRALRVMLLGDLVDAHEAHALGILALPPVPSAELDARTDAVAAALAERSPEAMARILDAVDVASHTGLHDGLGWETRQAVAARGSDDGGEGVQAFLDKRAAHFAGYRREVGRDLARRHDDRPGDDDA